MIAGEEIEIRLNVGGSTLFAIIHREFIKFYWSAIEESVLQAPMQYARDEKSFNNIAVLPA